MDNETEVAEDEKGEEEEVLTLSQLTQVIANRDVGTGNSGVCGLKVMSEEPENGAHEQDGDDYAKRHRCCGFGKKFAGMIAGRWLTNASRTQADVFKISSIFAKKRTKAAENSIPFRERQ